MNALYSCNWKKGVFVLSDFESDRHFSRAKKGKFILFMMTADATDKAKYLFNFIIY